jgi:hypothetical protein
MPYKSGLQNSKKRSSIEVNEVENVPIYVKVDRYRELLAVLQKVEAKLASTGKMLDDIQQLKNQEDAELKRWGDNLADIKQRLDTIRETFHQ